MKAEVHSGRGRQPGGGLNLLGSLLGDPMTLALLAMPNDLSCVK